MGKRKRGPELNPPSNNFRTKEEEYEQHLNQLKLLSNLFIKI